MLINKDPQYFLSFGVVISLEKEEEILRGYLGMEKRRLGFDFDAQIDEDLDS